MSGRLTLGLYNCYDPKQWHDIMRITLSRAGPVALAFGAGLVTFGFPFEQARRRGARSTEPLRSPDDVAGFIADGTSIGEGGEHFHELVEKGRFRAEPFPVGAAFPARHGRLVVTTPRPEAAKATTPLAVAKALASGQDQLVLFGLGPRGLPPEVLEGAPVHLEFTGQGISLETSTAIGALPALLHAHLEHLGTPAPGAPREVRA